MIIIAIIIVAFAGIIGAYAINESFFKTSDKCQDSYVNRSSELSSNNSSENLINDGNLKSNSNNNSNLKGKDNNLNKNTQEKSDNNQLKNTNNEKDGSNKDQNDPKQEKCPECD